MISASPLTGVAQVEQLGPDWNRRVVMIFAGQYGSHIQTGEDYETRTLADLFTLEPSNLPKAAGLAFIPSSYHGHDGREHKVQRERGSFVALTGDIDKGDHPLDRIETLVRAFAGDAAWLIYSSAHARPGSRRWRVIMPLERSVSFNVWHDAQHAFFRFMESEGVAMDWALDRAAQPVYLPNVPPSHQETGTLLRDEQGRPLYYQRVSSGTVAPGLKLSSGTIAAGLAAIARQREAEGQERERIRAEARQKRADRQKTDTTAIIDGFNESTSIETMLELYGYQRSPRSNEDWRSPYQQGGTYATQVIGDRWISLSGSDVAAGLGEKCKSGCYGDAYDLFVHFAHGGDHKAAFRELHKEREGSTGTNGQSSGGVWQLGQKPGNKGAAGKPNVPGSGASSGGRPVIEVVAGTLHVMATKAEDALIGADAPFYVRGGLVRPIVDDMPAAHGRRTKVARLAPVDANVLIDHLSRCAQWERWNARAKANVATNPPRDVAATILARDGEWRFRRLSGVITTQTLRPDGSLLLKPGYDSATQLLLLDPPQLPPIPDRPSKDDAAEALNRLDALLCEFPFIDEASRSVALSALITPVVRGALSVSPLHATTAPVAGSGKSYIIDLASAIATGERAPVIAAGQSEEETEKRLGAALLNGQSIVSIDNVNGHLGGDALCQMIERPVVSVRPLGVSKLVKIESRSTCFATGNNIQLLGDMTRRGLLCSLDPNMERPELRIFKADPFDLVLANRGEFVAAALTVVRAYIVAGSPGVLPPLASFEEWSRTVRSALVWLGLEDPCDTMERARGEDPVIAQLGGVLDVWYDAVNSEAKTTGAMVELAQTVNPMGNRMNSELYQTLLEVGDDRRGGISSKALGRYLARHKGRIVNGLKLIAAVDLHAKQTLWKVVRP